MDVASIAFAPIVREDARVLILGSLPGRRSLRECEYYAHPQNSFWAIMRECFRVHGSYAMRCEQLIDCRIAVWDVLAQSVRPGSMDADIREPTALANNFEHFFATHRDIELVCFNGQKAAQLFRTMVKLNLLRPRLRFETLPSTSPAYASMAFADKLTKWRSTIG